MTFTQALAQIKTWQADSKIIVLATGVFDILHIEHIRFLTAAQKAGDYLVVGIETDSRTRQMKGSRRPVNPAPVRLEQLQALRSVDLAFTLPSAFSTQAHWDAFMSRLKPDIYAVSSHTDYLDNKRQLTEKHGGHLKVVHQFNPDYSTTQLLTKLTRDL